MSQGQENGEGDETVAKRQKLTHGSANRERKASKIFVPFRTVGLVSPTDVPFTSLPLGKTTFQITTSVGRCLHTYDLLKGLNLVFLTRPQTPADITSIIAWKDRVFAAWGREREATGGHVGVWIFKRGKKVGELEMPLDVSEGIMQIAIFGSWIVGCCSSRIEVWKSATYEHYTTLTPTVAKKDSQGIILSGGMCNMPTFLNKIFVGKRDGGLDIWNLSTGKLVYTILPPNSLSGAVTALEPTPALSLLAIARADGSIVLHDIRTDKMKLTLNAKGRRSSTVTSISFRTDGLGAGDDGSKGGIMATTNANDGDVTFWDLNNGGRINGVLQGAHNPPSQSGESGSINKVQFLPGQDVMITSGLDNALKSWIFDANSLSRTPRILHSRCGHAAPVTRLNFVPSNSDGADTGGKWLMSAGRDQSLWGWSLRRDGQSTELSQGNVRKKAKKLGLLGKNLELEKSTTMEDLRAPEITSMACSLNRDGGMGASSGGGPVWTNASSKKRSTDASESNATGWESVVTGHRGDKHARTWFWGRKKAGRWAFESGDGTEVTSVAITSCGTFALLGSAGGSISMFNLQSGILRLKFPSSLTPAQARKLRMRHAAGDSGGPRKFALGEGRHKKAVTGMMVDGLNRAVISCSLDGKIKFWDFLTGCLQDEIEWFPMTAIISSQYHRPSDLVALSCDDLSIRVVDTETKKLVRELWGCLGQISDFCFSSDGRWIIATSMDSVIRVWDLPTGHLINAIRVESPCTALAFSDTGEFLATAHVDSVGINIWNNRSIFTHVPTRLIQEDEIAPAIAPTSSGESGQGLVDAAFEDEASEQEDDEAPYNSLTSNDQLSLDMLTLSLVPKSRWQTLLHLNTIRQRNKPKEPPKAPEKAPFFLPSLENPKKSQLAPTEEQNQVTLAERSRIFKMDRTGTASTFTTTLHTSSRSGNYVPFVEHLKTLPPSAADIEIRSLNLEELNSFVAALTHRLRQRRDYELVQAWMAVFLRIHGEAVPSNTSLRDALIEWRRWQESEGRRLRDLVGFCGGVVGFIRSTRT